MIDGLHCYETFAGGYVAFDWKAEFCFGPIDKISALLSGSSESFLIGADAEAKVVELRARQERPCCSKQIDSSPTDGLSTTRARWQREKDSGLWGANR
jgi:hypothetical protein